jgi:hypothetical protein
MSAESQFANHQESAGKKPMPWLKSPLVLIVGTQALFTAGDLLARANMRKGGFTLANFVTVWFIAYFTLRTLAMFGQLYVLANVPIGKSMALFGATSIALVNVLGVLLLGEVLTASTYVGVSLAVLAFVVIAL